MRFVVAILFPFALLGWLMLAGFLCICAWLWPDEVMAAEHRVNELGI
jgi:hypothetical protein